MLFITDKLRIMWFIHQMRLCHYFDRIYIGYTSLGPIHWLITKETLSTLNYKLDKQCKHIYSHLNLLRNVSFYNIGVKLLFVILLKQKEKDCCEWTTCVKIIGYLICIQYTLKPRLCSTRSSWIPVYIEG